MRIRAGVLLLALTLSAHATVATIWYSRAASVGVTDGTGDAQVTSGAWPRVSPDGNLLLFHRDAPDPARGNVYVRNLQTSPMPRRRGAVARAHPPGRRAS